MVVWDSVRWGAENMAKLNAAKPDAGVQLTVQVEREIAAVAKKIRTNDLVTGAALLIVGTLAYAVVALLLDKWLTLPAWVRQLEFLGFLTAILGLSYFAIVRPLMRVVNPRYVARQVEATMPQSKNELINWVDLQEQEMAGSVKSALASRAAAGFGDAAVRLAAHAGLQPVPFDRHRGPHHHRRDRAGRAGRDRRRR
jgi:collagen type III alpha